MTARGIGGIALVVAACAAGPAARSGSAPAGHPEFATPVGARDPLDQPTPLSPEVRKGTLPNGLTYYVRHHPKPEARAALWLVVDAGSVLEDIDEQGIAHFVEHMAFNGTQRFPKQAIYDFVERAGMTMGADVNAYTARDETVYQFTVPTDDEATMLRGLDVLYDIAGSVSFDPAEVELERPVILEEWRLRRGAARRVAEKQVPVLFQGSRYADQESERLPEAIKRASVDALKQFYAAWYRPESMAVIAVGDFAPERMDREIRRRFVGLRPSAKRLVPPRFTVPNAHAPAVVVTSDPELRYSFVNVIDKVDPLPERTKRDYRGHLVEALYLQILDSRLATLRDDPKNPFVQADVARRKLTRTLDAIIYSIRAKEGRVEEALELLLGEIERARKHGVLLSETLRAAKELRVRYEVAFGEADRATTSTLAGELVRNFLEGEQVPGPKLELEWAREFLPGITLAELGEIAKSRSVDRGRVIAVSTPGSVTPPTPARITEIGEKVRSLNVPRWHDKTVDEPLIASPPKPGSVVHTARDASADASVWTLSNGVRVVVKPTPFPEASVVLRGFVPGGMSLVSDADFAHARFADEIVGRSGAGKFSAYDLNRVLAGTRVSVSIDLREIGGTVEASARAADTKTMLELLYLRLTAARIHKNAFEVWKGRRLDTARHRADSPDQAFADEVSVLLSKDHSRRRPATVEAIERVDMEKSLALWKERFSDFGGATFAIVGKFDPAVLKPLVETYLGSLPAKPTHEHWKDPKIPYPTGKIEKTVHFGAEPKSRVRLIFAGPSPWGLDAWHDAWILEELLKLRLVEVLRERLGGTYVVNVDARLEREPAERRRLEVAWSCAPENVEKLTASVFDELRAIAKSGIGEEYLAKVRLRLQRQRETSLKENGWWAERLLTAYRRGDDFGTTNDIAATVRRVTSENVKAIAARMFDEQNYVLAVLRPASAAKPALRESSDPVEVLGSPDVGP